jgi:ParB family transcriptional regulator, chromosome partitioning protein
MQEQNHGKKPSSVFFIEVDRIKPNPLQPRREFDEVKLQELSESIRAYGVLQPLVVVRQENVTPTGVITEYELIAGERRLRASRLAGLAEVPVMIREEPAEKVKLEMALVENVQREDLSALDRATAFKKLHHEFGLTHKEIGARIGRSREYVANTVRLLSLPGEIQQALQEGHITEGHTRPLLMLGNSPLEQKKLLEDILYRNISVREAERVSRNIAVERARRKPVVDPVTKTLEEKLREALGTRVSIERKGVGGRISIDFFSDEELHGLLSKFINREGVGAAKTLLASAILAPSSEEESQILPADFNTTKVSEDKRETPSHEEKPPQLEEVLKPIEDLGTKPEEAKAAPEEIEDFTI